MFGSSRYKTAKRNVRSGYRRNSNSSYAYKYVYRFSNKARKK